MQACPTACRAIVPVPAWKLRHEREFQWCQDSVIFQEAPCSTDLAWWMTMLARGAMIVWAMAAMVLPPAAAFAAETTSGASAPAIESTSLNAPAEPELVFEDSVESISLGDRPLGLNYKLDETVPDVSPDGQRFDFAQRPASASALRFSPALAGSRPGWAFSGRAGPLRWLTPLDNEGEITLRLGRIPGQPRPPGLGRLNMSIHYSFE